MADKRLLTIFTLLTAAPGAYALTGIQPFDIVIRMIGNFFTAPSLSNPTIQEGVMRFLLFVLVFAVSFWSLNKTPAFDRGDRRIAGTVSFVIAFIGVMFMPDNWLMATGGTMAVLTGSLVLIILGSLIYIAMVVLRGSIWKNIFGFLLLLLVFNLLIVYAAILGADASNVITQANALSADQSPSSQATGNIQRADPAPPSPDDSEMEQNIQEDARNYEPRGPGEDS
jgi:hypothetical protein